MSTFGGACLESNVLKVPYHAGFAEKDRDCFGVSAPCDVCLAFGDAALTLGILEWKLRGLDGRVSSTVRSATISGARSKCCSTDVWCPITSTLRLLAFAEL